IKHAKKWCPQCCSIEEAKQIAHNRNNHKWSFFFAHIKHYNSWYPDCAYNRYLTLEEAKQIAHSSNSVRLASVKYSNSWCPYCAGTIQNILLLKKLNKLHIAGKNTRANGLELDIPYYNYSFAIEVQGEQYAKYIKFFYRRDPDKILSDSKSEINSRMNC
ncbi:2213_t:CDS:2, partial [Gigaspora margarita]